MKLPIYLDYSATTPVDPRVAEKMMQFMTMDGTFGNPASRSHRFGWQAEEAVDIARNQIADLVGADPREIVFTSGATESDNLAIKGAANFYQKKGKHIITSKTEHKAVLDTCRQLEREGFEVTYLPVDKYGIIDMDYFKKSLRDDTTLVSVMLANNEIGTIEPIKEIASIASKKGIIVHTDAVQAVGKMNIDVNDLGVHMLTFSGHKIYAPKGIGVLYIDIELREKIHPIIHGGQQEGGLRAGTENIPYIVGLGKACDILLEKQDTEILHIKKLRDTFEKKVLENIPDTYVNGHIELRVPSISDIVFRYIEGEALMVYAREVCCSAGSACTSASTNPSHVLSAIKVDDVDIHGALRFSFGRFNTMEEVDKAVEILKESVEKLRKMTPLYNK